MTQEQIDALIAVRNSITDICTEFTTNTAAIDAVLAEIPAGVDNRVDLLLGRPEAVLPPREGYILNPVVTLELEAETISVFDDEMRRLCADYDIEAPEYPGMWM